MHLWLPENNFTCIQEGNKYERMSRMPPASSAKSILGSGLLNYDIQNSTLNLPTAYFNFFNPKQWVRVRVRLVQPCRSLYIHVTEQHLCRTQSARKKPRRCCEFGLDFTVRIELYLGPVCCSYLGS